MSESKLLQRLHDAKRSGVYRATSDDAILECTQAGDLDVAMIDARQQHFHAIAQALAFPGWFGNNWDALEDSLGDLSWRKGAGHVLVFTGYPGGDELGELIDVLRSSAQYWAGRGTPFFAVFIDAARKLELPDLYRNA